MRTIAVLNQKGGVGKTTTVANTAAALAAKGARVVVIDFDPQAHLTIHLGLEPQTIEIGSYQVMTSSAGFEDNIMLMRLNLWLLPANINLVGAESELVSVVGRETILREALQSCKDRFDYCFIDCSPSLGLLTLNALAAAEDVLIPLLPHFLALQGLGKLLQTIELVNKRINPNLKVKWVLLCMFDGRASLPNEVRDDVKQFLDEARGGECPWSQAQILPAYIRRNIKLAEAPSYGQTIFEYEPGCNGAEDYRRVAELIHAQFQKPAAPDISEPEIQEPVKSSVIVQPGAQEPPKSPVIIQPDAEVPLEPPVIIQPDSEEQPGPDDVPQHDAQEPVTADDASQAEAQAAEEEQNRAPIEIKSVSSEQQEAEPETAAEPSELAQTPASQEQAES
ncbi:MAG: AAA family ATPase [Phycisphaerales bacterium]|jgi:chromosome partitioning protein